MQTPISSPSSDPVHAETMQRTARAQKAVLTFRYRLLGAAQENPAWLRAVDALEFALQAHEGMTRDDKITPYIVHPVEVAMYALTLRGSLLQPVQTIAAALLHDVLEDCDVSFEQLHSLFGEDIARPVLRVSKPRLPKGQALDLVQHYAAMGQCPVSSILKGCDRVNNQGTLGEQKPGRQLRKVDETEAHILPMLKAARRRFAQQELAYENIKLVLRNQIALVRAVHAGREKEQAGQGAIA